jgi:hypothetical protein
LHHTLRAGILSPRRTHRQTVASTRSPGRCVGLGRRRARFRTPAVRHQRLLPRLGSSRRSSS